MPTTTNLTQASMEEMQHFLNSFDVVLSDCDGVIWYQGKPIPGAMAMIRRLQELQKRLYLVTNNSTISTDRYCEKLRLNGLDVEPEQIITTAKAISWYLKKINFTDEAFVVASPPFRQTLIDSGIKLTPGNLNVVEGDALATIKAVQDRPSVKAVIVDFCVHFDWGKLAFAINCLKRKDVLYISGAQDEWVICGLDNKVLGPGPLINIITKYSGRAPTECAKPSEVLRDYILNECDVKDRKRCLFIGDTMNYDMKFGTMCGFRKLFVGTGVDNVEDAEQTEETRPDFYIPSLGLLHPIIDLLHNDSEEDGH
ncbi:Phosphoglycolate phosphatase [Habropoda laboriosa]|uniref:Phosphoglycolate phosphatase n=1 Tax=Habropoda laboriosa TaxID=597456 RepID=A0A0L7R396_9HYME|nr:PREDICTED: glycerol-3-phosphate phosphatase-like [Habropoda laboriosa]KOC65304.1 Phosphoglycolate phosphatase [Habropoda laboriosa]